MRVNIDVNSRSALHHWLLLSASATDKRQCVRMQHDVMIMGGGRVRVWTPVETTWVFCLRARDSSSLINHPSECLSHLADMRVPLTRSRPPTRLNSAILHRWRHSSGHSTEGDGTPAFSRLSDVIVSMTVARNAMTSLVSLEIMDAGIRNGIKTRIHELMNDGRRSIDRSWSQSSSSTSNSFNQLVLFSVSVVLYILKLIISKGFYSYHEYLYIFMSFFQFC